MKVQVNPERCQGHTLCAMAAPSVFILGESDGHASVDQRAVTEDNYSAIRDAAATCPEQAIEITED